MRITDKSARPNAVVELPVQPVVWEHRAVKLQSGAPIDEFGADGWELVSVVPCLMDPSMVVCYFKRRPR